jgi:iron complex outermembrane receptor protein
MKIMTNSYRSAVCTHNGLRALPAAMLLSSSFLLATTTVAQGTGEGRYALEEVVVTARIIEEGLQNAPLSVTALTGQELENRGSTDIVDVASAAPNVSFETDGAISGFGAAPRVSIRGIGQGDFVINADPAVGIYADGVYLGRSLGSLLDLADVERAEALRGPQGTLFGRNSIGGAINIISKRPDVGGDFQGSVALDAGEKGYYNIRASANLPISDTIAARASVLHRQRDGYIKALQYDDFYLGGEDVTGVRGQLRFQASEDLTFDLDADFSQRRDTPAAGYAARLGDLSVPETSLNRTANIGQSSSINARVFNGETPPARPTAGQLVNLQQYYTTNPGCATLGQAYRDATATCFGNYWKGSVDGSHAVFVDRTGKKIQPEQELDSYGYSARLNWNLGSVKLATISAWRGFDSVFYNSSPTPIAISANNNEQFDQDQVSHEVQLSGSIFNNRVDWLTGAYYFKEDGYERVAVVAPTSNNAYNNVVGFLPLDNIQNRYIDNTSSAIFGQGIVHITDALELTLGARYTASEKRALYVNFNDNAVTALNLAGRQTAAETNYLANLAWQVGEDTLLYAQYADGFRDGGFPSRTGAGVTELINFDPEFVEAYEVGVKTTTLDNRLRMNFSVFTTSYTEMQQTATSLNPTGGIAPATDNLGDATLSGAELEVNFVATDNLRFDLGVGYLKNKIDSLVGGGIIMNDGTNVRKIVTTDFDLPFAPKLEANFGANYSILIGGSEIRMRADYIYESDSQSNLANYDQTYIPSRFRVNANASYIPADANWQVQIGARNLTDESDVIRVDLNPGLAAATSEYTTRPREAYLQLRFDWGK